MSFDVHGLLRLWSDPLPQDEREAAAAFRAFYSDPVRVNDVPLTAADLVARARSLQTAFEDAERRIVDLVEADGKVVIAFRMRGRQVGPLATSLGDIPATGRVMELRAIDILTVTGGRITDVWMVADELGALAAAQAVAFTRL
jgi:predicted ester cyclase